MEAPATNSCAKDYRIILYGLFSCVHYGWDICAGRKWQKLAFLVFRAASHVALLILFEHDTRPHSTEAVRIATAIFLLIGVWDKMQEMPTIWDSDAWSIQMDTTVGLWLLAHGYSESGGNRAPMLLKRPDVREDTVDDALYQTIRDMFANYYFAAAFWKINSHFLDPDASCATMFVVQMVVNYVRPLLSWCSFLTKAWKKSSNEALMAFAAVAKAVAPMLALTTELVVGAFMVLGSLAPRRYSDGLQALGSLSALGFHLMVCMLPAPNDISGFALNCAPRHIVFATGPGASAAWYQARKHALPLSAITIIGAAVGVQAEWTENNWAFFFYMFVGGFVALSLVSDFSFESRLDMEDKFSLLRGSQRRPMWSRAAVGVAFCYSFVTLVLGLQEESTTNMFANLKAGHGGSNHFFLPTGLLFHWFADASNSHPFGGGIIRIENTTSNWLRTIYPADFTHLLEPAGLTEIMESIGNPPPIYFNPGANRNLGLLRDVPQRFFRYTVPALEFKRLLHEAKERDKDFTLVYTKLPGTHGDEKWRAIATERIVSVEVRDGTLRECKVKNKNDIITGKTSQWVPCHPNELPYVDFVQTVPWILRRMSLYHAYPIVVDNEVDEDRIPVSIRCFGP